MTTSFEIAFFSRENTMFHVGPIVTTKTNLSTCDGTYVASFDKGTMSHLQLLHTNHQMEQPFDRFIGEVFLKHTFVWFPSYSSLRFVKSAVKFSVPKVDQIWFRTCIYQRPTIDYVPHCKKFRFICFDNVLDSNLFINLVIQLGFSFLVSLDVEMFFICTLIGILFPLLKKY